MILLGVNIDHVATIREARKTYEPDPVWAATLAELAGADGITVHLREDRRHIQDRDVRLLRETVQTQLNLEMACTSEITSIACEILPDQATLVPERREEITTEGGLDVIQQRDALATCTDRLKDKGIVVSFFLDPEASQIEAASELGADAVELHTGSYSLAKGSNVERELNRLIEAAQQIHRHGMRLHAGHGLHYKNVGPIAAIAGMRELNIGHSIVARAVLVGFERAVREMRAAICESI